MRKIWNVVNRTKSNKELINTCSERHAMKVCVEAKFRQNSVPEKWSIKGNLFIIQEDLQ